MNLSASFLEAMHVKRVIARVVACSMLLVLSSCQIPRFRQSEPGPGLPTGFNVVTGPQNSSPLAAVVGGVGVANLATGVTSSENSARLGIEEFYNDPILTQLIYQAVASNRELKMLEEDVLIARNEILSRRGAFLPLVGLRAGAGWDRHSAFTPEGAAERQLEYAPGKHFPATPGDFMLGLNFLIPLDVWRELRNARDAAVQRYLAAFERRNSFVTRMIADIAENYYGLMALDQRLETLDQTIEIQQRSLDVARALFVAGRVTELPVQRFQAEVRRNQSEKLIVRQEIVEVENRINFLAGRFPQAVERNSAGFLDLTIHVLGVGVPAQLLQNRPDVRQAERELVAAGLDVKVARAHFFPRLDLTGSVGYQAFNPRYLFNPEALILNAGGELAAPLINKAAIRAEYLTANARQLESVYNYQRVLLNAVTEVVNRLSMVENYSNSIVIKQQQLQALDTSVDVAGKLFQAVRIEYVDVLFAQRDRLEARTVLINTKRQQLSAIVNTYQALGGGVVLPIPPLPPPQPNRSWFHRPWFHPPE